jgi:DnaJ family protein C protein 13
LTKNAIITLDPSDFKVTNSFSYGTILKVTADEKNAEEFKIEIEKAGKFVFRCTHRKYLLCQLFEQWTKNKGKLKSFGPYAAERFRKSQVRQPVQLAAAPFGLVELDPSGHILQEYMWVNVTRVGIDNNSRSVFFLHSGRIKIFFLADVDGFMAGCRAQVKALGMTEEVPIIGGQSVEDAAKKRMDYYYKTGLAVSVFNVNKVTRRSNRVMPRQMHITEQFIVEKDSSGFQFVSCQKISDIYAVVRSWSNPREFTIEYVDSTSRKYSCSVRDSLLALLQDVAHSVGNVRVIVTGEVSDSLRLMPRFTEEVYTKKFIDSFFGPFSIEAWFLRKLDRACISEVFDIDDVVTACRDLNANVPFPGIAEKSDHKMVKACMVGILKSVQYAVTSDVKNPEVSHSRAIAVMLQSLYRILPATAAYKGFIEIQEFDPRFILMSLLKFDNDFVNYWALQVLMALCKCPGVRQPPIEFINKHTLLVDGVLKCLMEMMSSRIVELEVYLPDSEDDPESEEDEAEPIDGWPTETNNWKLEQAKPLPPEATEEQIAEWKISKRKLEEEIARIKHKQEEKKKDKELRQQLREAKKTAKEQEAKAAAALVDISGPAAPLDGVDPEGDFFPNSLVIVCAASLLEATVCSAVDTSSPELVFRILDLLSERSEILVHMLRSPSFLIMENASILMHILIKNKPECLESIRECALSECLVLKQFYHSVFSPSPCQRFISRFLCATWMSGAESVDGKKLLRRLIPSGLIEYLKHTPISEEHRRNLDDIEEEFYSVYGGGIAGGQQAVAAGGVVPGKQQQSSTDLLTRMRNRLTQALRTPALQESGITLPVPGNFRIVFHAMTNDHQLPDLIWNEQTRIELRSSLEREFIDYEREQQLRGFRRVAWNYQQFFVTYESLKYEIQVGPIYIRCFLDTGDAFIRDLENPSHAVLFEKMMRRVLVNINRDTKLSVLCTRCMSRLYEVCQDKIGEFDDMMIIVRMLEDAKVIELQHCILDLLELLCLEENNLSQLLSREFAELYLKFASLAHLNPDQIGNVLARATNKVLMLTDSSSNGPAYQKAGLRGTARAPGESEEEVALKRTQQRSQWVPDDAACPRMWYVAAYGGPLPPPPEKQRGPFRVTELLDMLDSGSIDSTTLVGPSLVEDLDTENFTAQVDTGRWKKLTEYFQFRMQGGDLQHALYSPAEVSLKAITTIQRLSGLHKAVSATGVPFYPVPISKRLFSDMDSLSVLAQLLLSNDKHVVDIAANLLTSLVEHNMGTSSKLYLTGAFFFGVRYTSNNIKSISDLFKASHLMQSFGNDSSTYSSVQVPIQDRSILGVMLPPSLLYVLDKKGADEFAKIFTGSADDPEVIWNPDLRKHLVEMVNTHLGDFPLRLRQFTMARYDFCPIPKIMYPTLDKELYCHFYYIRNLINEVRFPDWPIYEPLVLLRDVIERWRKEMAKGSTDGSTGTQSTGGVSVKAAKTILGLPDTFKNEDLRKAYKNMARKYHPDKNPNGQEMFQKIQKAYEILSSVELEVTETNLEDVVILVKTQSLIYRRFAAKLADQKYPVYHLLIAVMRPPGPDQLNLPLIDSELLECCVELMYRTCFVSLLNSKEFVRAGGVPKLHDCIDFALRSLHDNNEAVIKLAELILEFGMKTLSLIAYFDIGREALAKQGCRYAETMYNVIGLDKSVPLAVEFCIEAVARSCSDPALQLMFMKAGLLWRLAPMLLAYDDTIEKDFEGLSLLPEDQRKAFNQHGANMHAALAAKALGRMAGLMFDELASEKQEPFVNALNKLFTVPIAKLFRNRRPQELLNALNENVEKPTKIWNVGMRSQLSTFLLLTDRERVPGSSEEDLKPSEEFFYTNLTEELCVCGVYVRVFNKNGDTRDIDDPSVFTRALITYLWEHVIGPKATYDENNAVQKSHVDYVTEAIKTMAVNHEYTAADIAEVPHGIDVAFSLIHNPDYFMMFSFGVELMVTLCVVPEFVSAVIAYKYQRLWIMVKALCLLDHPSVPRLWAAAENIASTPDGLQALMDNGAIMKVLGIIFGVPGYNVAFQNRLAANTLLAKFLWNPIKGSDAAFMLRRFLPEPVVMLLRSRAGQASLQALDQTTENPELIWTKEMQGELRDAVFVLLTKGASVEATKTGAEKFTDEAALAALQSDDSFREVVALPLDYFVKFAQLENEMYIGGVYIRLYLKQPTFRLSNPVLFVEKLVEYWDSSFSIQVPDPKIPRQTYAADAGDQKSIVLGQEDFFSLVSSCIICVLKGEPAVLEHLLSWGVVHNYINLLARAVDTGKRGSPMVCIIRIMRQLVVKPAVVYNVASSPIDPIKWFMRAMILDDDESAAVGNLKSLHKDSTLACEVLKIIFQSIQCSVLPELVGLAVRDGLPNFLLDNILGAPAATLNAVRSGGTLKLYAVDVLKALVAVQSEHGAMLHLLYESHPAYSDYRHQSHDLFLTVSYMCSYFSFLRLYLFIYLSRAVCLLLLY